MGVRWVRGASRVAASAAWVKHRGVGRGRWGVNAFARKSSPLTGRIPSLLATVSLLAALLVGLAGPAAAASTTLISSGPDMVVGEADGIITVPVTLSAASTSTITVGFSTYNGTAIGNSTASAGTDFISTSGTLTFNAGETSSSISVQVLEDATATGNHSFTVQLSSPTGGTLARAVTRVNIVDNQAVVSSPPISAYSATVDASAGSVTVPVVLGGLSGEASNSTVTVNYATADGSAVSGTDYSAKNGTLSFAPGETVQNITIPILDNNSTAVPTRSFSVNLSGQTNATIAVASGTVTIGAHGAIAVATPLISAAPDMVVGEGDGYVDVPVTLSAPGQSTVTVAANLENGTASGNTTGGSGFDFLCLTSGCNTDTVTFAPGQTTATLRVELLEDATATGNHSFTVQLSSPTGGTLARAVTRVNIVDNQAVVSSPPISAYSATVDASAGSVTVPVVLGGLSGEASNSTVTVNYATADGSAVSGTDYSAKNGTLSFAPGETVQNITIPILDNNSTAVPTRSFSVNLSGQTNATIAVASGTVTIGAHGAIAVATPLISAAPDMVVGEGDGYVDVPVTLSAPGQSTVTVAANLENGTASGNTTGGSGFDFLCLTSGCNTDTVTFAPGQTTATLRVELLEDATATGNHSFTVQLSSPTGGTLARAVTRVNIVDNQAVVSSPPISAYSATVDASAGSVTVPVVLGGLSGEASNSTVTVNYATADGSAVSGTDYSAKNGTLSFAPGETVQNITIPILDNNSTAVPTRSFSVNLSGQTNATIAVASGTVTIGAHGAIAVATPLISAAPDMVVGEGDGYVDVPVTLSAPGQSTVTVAANLENGTASGNTTGGSGFDFLCLTSGCNTDTVTFAPGQTTATLRVELLEDATATGNHSFTVQLSSPTGGTLARAVTRVNIVDNQAVVSSPPISAYSATVDASAGSVTVPVVLGGLSGEASNSTVTVNYATADGSAVSGTDYSAKNGTLSFAPGETVQNITIPILDNNSTAVPTRSFSVNLSGQTNATIAVASGTVTIGAHGAIAVATPLISAAPDMVVGEGDGYVDVPVTLSAPGQSTVTVAANLENGTASGNTTGGSGFDFLCLTSGCNTDTVTFAPGQTTATLRVELLEDVANTSHLTFTVQLSSPANATIGTGTDTVTIVSNLINPTAASTVSATPTTVPADGVSQSVITVTLTDGSADPVADQLVSLTPNAGTHSAISFTSRVSNPSGQVVFDVTDGTPESVTYTVTDTTDGLTLSATPTVSFVGQTPTLTQISPNEGPASGNVQVTLSGTGFSTTSGATTVKFGSTAATAVICSSTTSCTATEPAGTAGTASVTVAVGGQTSGGVSFTYYTPGLLRVTTSPALASQITVDGNISDTWGLTWAKEPPGSHTVCFAAVQGYITPACQSVTVASGVTTTVTGTFTERGFLHVTTSPAVNSKITYTPSGSTALPMDNYGAWTDIPVGTYSVCFGAVAGYSAPACQSATVTAGATTNITGTFTVNSGATGPTGVGLLRVTTSPAVPSQITVDGNITDTWGLNWLQIAPGSHTVCFSSVQGYTTPACQTVTVASGATTTVTGTFTQRGFLQVETSPAVAGTIYVNGTPADDWGYYTDLPAGTYTVCFGAVAGETAPACQTPTVTAGTTTTITGTY